MPQTTSDVLDVMVGGLGDWDKKLDPEVWKAVEPTLRGVSDPDGSRERLAVTLHLAEAYELNPDEVADQIPVLAADYARQKWGDESPYDQRAFYARLGKDAEEARNERETMGKARALMLEEFATGAGFSQAWFRTRQQLEESGAYWEPSRGDLYREAMAKDYEGMAELRERVEEPLRVVRDYLANRAAGDELGFDGKRMESAALSALHAIPAASEEERKELQQFVLSLAVGAMGERGKAQNERMGLGAKMGKRIERAGDRLVQGVGEAIAKVAGDEGMGAFLDLKSELEAAASGRVAPMAGTNFGARVLLAAADSVPEMVALRSPIGVAASVMAAQVDLARELRRNGVERADSEWVGAAAAVPYTALNWFSSKLVFGDEVPGLQPLLRRFPSLLAQGMKARGKRAALRFALGWGEQAGQEVAQAAVAPVAQMMAGQFKEAIPGPDWDRWAHEQKQHAPEMLGVTALFAAVGAGTGQFRQDRGLADMHGLLGSESLLTAIGFKADAVEEIRKGKNPQERAAAIESLWEERAPTGQAAQEARAEIEADIKEVKEVALEEEITVQRVPGQGEASRWVAVRGEEVVAEEASPEALAADIAEGLPPAEETGAPELVALPEGSVVEALGERFPALEGVGEKVAHWKVQLPGESKAEVLTAEALANRGFLPPVEVAKPAEPALAETGEGDGSVAGRIAEIQALDVQGLKRMAVETKGQGGLDRPGGYSGVAYDIGRSVTTVEEYKALVEAAQQARTKAAALKQSGRPVEEIWDEMQMWDTQAHLFREAHEAATGSGSAEAAVRSDPNYRPPIVLAEDGTPSLAPPEATAEEKAEHAMLTETLAFWDKEIADDEKALGELKRPASVPPVPEDAPRAVQWARQKAVDKRAGQMRKFRRREKRIEERLLNAALQRLEVQARLGVPGAAEELMALHEREARAGEPSRDEMVMDYLRSHRLPTAEVLRAKGSTGGEVADLDLPAKFFDPNSRLDMDRIAAGLTEALAEAGDPEMAAKVRAGEQMTPNDALEMFAQAWKAEAAKQGAASNAVPRVEGVVPPAGHGPGGSLVSLKTVAWADDVLKRVAREGRLFANPFGDPEIFAAYVVKGAQLIESGVRDFVAWGREMVKLYGEEIRPYLKALFQEAVEKVEQPEPNQRKLGTVRYLGQGAASALETWSTFAAARLREFEFKLRRGTVDWAVMEGGDEVPGANRVVDRATEGWAQAIPRIRALRAKVFAVLDRGERQALNLALANRDEATTRELMAKAGALEEFDAARAMMADLRAKLVAMGEEIGWLDDYWPRWRKNGEALTGFLAAEADNPMVFTARQAAAAEYRREPTEDEVAAFLARGLRDPRELPGSAKRREIARLEAGMAAVYARWDDAAEHYVEEFTEAIAAREFFGESFVPLPAEAGAVQRVPATDVGASVRGLVDRWVAAGYVEPQDAARTRELLESRLGFQAIHKIARHLRDWGLISSITQFTTTITQLTDWWVAFSRAGGLASPVTALRKVARATSQAVRGTSEVKREDFALDVVTQLMIERGGLAPLVDSLLKWSGLSYVNALGQQTVMNVELGEMREELAGSPGGGRTGELLAAVFPDPVEQNIVRSDLLWGGVTDRVLALAWQRASHMIPTSLSEMPAGYLRHPLGRLFYTLKAFDLKRFDVLRREAFSRLRSGVPGERARGLRHLAELSVLFVLAGASKDMLNALLVNRETDWPDEIESNIWKFFMLSRWAMRRGVTPADSALETGAKMVGNLPAAALDSVLPPFAYVELPARDAKRWLKALEDGEEFDWSEAESVKLFPVVGRAAYGWVGGGSVEKKRKGKRRKPVEAGPLPSVAE